MSIESEGKHDASQQAADAGTLQAEATNLLHTGQSNLPHQHDDATAAQSTPLKQSSSGDSAIHFEVGRAPGLNTDHFHQQSRELVFQHDSHGMPVSFHTQGDIDATGLPQIQLYDANRAATYPPQRDNLGPPQPGRDENAPAHDTAVPPPDGDEHQQPPHDAVPSPDGGAHQWSPHDAAPPTSDNLPHSEFTYHTVQHGDNLWKIARENLPQGASNQVTADYVHQIEADNPMPNPNLIMPGQTIKLRHYMPPAEHDTTRGAEHGEQDVQHEPQRHYRTAQHPHYKTAHHPHIHHPNTHAEQDTDPNTPPDSLAPVDDRMTPSTNRAAPLAPPDNHVVPHEPPTDHASPPTNRAASPPTNHATPPTDPPSTDHTAPHEPPTDHASPPTNHAASPPADRAAPPSTDHTAPHEPPTDHASPPTTPFVLPAPVEPPARQPDNLPAHLNDKEDPPPPAQGDKPATPTRDVTQPNNDKTEDLPPTENPLAQDTEVAQERHRLTELAQQKMGDGSQEYHRLRADMSYFEDREHTQLGATYRKQGMTAQEAAATVSHEIAGTYREAATLLSTDQTDKLTDTQLQHLASEEIHQAAYSTHIDQGQHATCQTDVVEGRTYTLAPAQASKLVTEVALTGKYTAPDGTVVKVDPTPHDLEALSYPVKDGQRSHASQIFQETAINLAWAKKDPSGETQFAWVQNKFNQQHSAGEELLKNGERITHMYGQAIGPGVPALTPEDLTVMSNLITGRHDKSIVVANPTSPQDLQTGVQQLDKQGGLPAVLYVYAGQGSFQARLGWHTVLLGGYISAQNGEPGKIIVDNSWGNAWDKKYGTMDVNTLYQATQEPSEQ